VTWLDECHTNGYTAEVVKPTLPVPVRPAEQDPAEPVDLGQRKERILHTRVPASLDRHIKRRARGLGMSVSTVVRNVLLNTFGLVEDIVTDGTNVALALTGQEAIPATGRGRQRETADTGPSGILAWQEAVLNLNAVCDHCNAVLPRGSRAALGVREQRGPRTIICRRCLRRLGDAAPRPTRGA